MKKILLSVAALVAICLLSVLIAWLGGYNFDRRGYDVAMWSVLTLCIAAWAVGMINLVDSL
jgi:hypothetical protein